MVFVSSESEVNSHNSETHTTPRLFVVEADRADEESSDINGDDTGAEYQGGGGLRGKAVRVDPNSLTPRVESRSVFQTILGALSTP